MEVAQGASAVSSLVASGEVEPIQDEAIRHQEGIHLHLAEEAVTILRGAVEEVDHQALGACLEALEDPEACQVALVAEEEAACLASASIQGAVKEQVGAGVAFRAVGFLAEAAFPEVVVVGATCPGLVGEEWAPVHPRKADGGGRHARAGSERREDVQQRNRGAPWSPS